MPSGPVTEAVAEFIASATFETLPAEVAGRIRLLVFDAVGTLAASTHPLVTSSAGIGAFAAAHGGAGPATLIGQSMKTDVVTAALANGTRGYAIDMEPHHPEAILHPIAVMLPTALALGEARACSGREVLAAVAVGCEVAYRVSIALDPKQLYALGFHPSAVCGTFGAAAAAAVLLELDAGQVVRALGLAGLQASGLMAWEDDPREDARPFQMGMAARNGMTAALLAESGFGAPDRIFDAGHTIFRAFGRDSGAEALPAGPGGKNWLGVTELAVKPYPCVAFLHPALDALDALVTEHGLTSRDVEVIRLRFAASGCHCIDANPLRSHCAQYVLPVRLARGGLVYTDLFSDLREEDPEVARLAARTEVVHDRGEFEDLFPDFYAGEITLVLTDGRTVSGRSDIARGYPEAPLTRRELDAKFTNLVRSVATRQRCEALREAAAGLGDAGSVTTLAGLLGEPAVTEPDKAD